MGKFINNYVEDIQSLLDAGYTRNKTAELLQLHHKTVGRLVEKGEIEIYVAFDEVADKRHLYQNFEWLWEEDELERISKIAFDSLFYLDRDDEQLISVGKYVRENYGTLKNYLYIKNLSPLQDFIFIKCKVCRDYAKLSDWYEYKKTFVGFIP